MIFLYRSAVASGPMPPRMPTIGAFAAAAGSAGVAGAGRGTGDWIRAIQRFAVVASATPKAAPIRSWVRPLRVTERGVHRGARASQGMARAGRDASREDVSNG